MANLKISQLPEYTGSTNGSWLIANNSAETETFKIERENFLSGYATSTDLSSVSSSIATTDLNQNNTIATLATTSSLSALSSSIATTDLNQNNTIATLATTASLNALSSSIASAGYAITGSNTFIGTETISGSVLIQGAGNSLEVNGGNFRVSGSIGINASSPSGSKFLFFNNAAGSAGTTVSYNPASTGTFTIFQSGSGAINIGSNSGTNILFGNTKITGSAHSITGSLGISGNVQMTGSLTQTGSLVVSSSVGGIYNQLFSAHGNYIKGNLGSNYIDSDSGSNYIFGSRIQLNGPGNTTGAVVQVQGNLSITGSFGVSGSIYQTGSVQGNINALSISSNTASLNLNDANFFTLQLVSGSATHLNPSNIKPGQTISVFVNTVSGSSITFPSSVKQTSSDPYIPTAGTGLDILTLISKDASNLYLVNAKNFV